MGGGGGKGGTAPTAPDFNALAQQQGQMSQQNVDTQTQNNRVNQTNAFGANSSWSKDPTTGQWTQSSSLGGDLGTAANNLMGQAANQGAAPTGTEARDQAIGSAYSQAMSRLKPEWDQRTEQSRAQLAAQGLDPSSEAAQAQTGNLDRARNDAETSAMASAIGQGTEAGNAIFNQGQTTANSPYQRLSMLNGLTQQAGYSQAGQAQTPDMLGAAQQSYQAQQDAYAKKQGSKNSTMSGLGSLAGMAGGMMIGGPAGAAMGSQLGGMAGGALAGG